MTAMISSKSVMKIRLSLPTAREETTRSSVVLAINRQRCCLVVLATTKFGLSLQDRLNFKPQGVMLLLEALALILYSGRMEMIRCMETISMQIKLL